MEYVKMPEMLSPEVAKVLAENMGELRAIMEDNAAAMSYGGEIDINAPRKIKFILFLNNVVIININAVSEEEEEGYPQRPA